MARKQIRSAILYCLLTFLMLGVMFRASAIASDSSGAVALSSEEIYIPAGQFLMGCSGDLSSLDCGSDCRPLHGVYLNAFYIDRTEVTNAQYRACVNAGACLPPQKVASNTRPDYFTNPAYDDYPVIEISQSQAAIYCQWLGRRLPSEAEWEKAARGDDLRFFPWGNERPTCELANFTQYTDARILGLHPCRGDTARVGSYPDGASPYGVLDMAGNVREWISDWYGSRYYYNSPYYNPQGPPEDEAVGYAARGGSWADYTSDALAVWTRYDGCQVDDLYTIGFRCARDAGADVPSPTPTMTPTPTPTPFAVQSADPSESTALWIAYPGRMTMVIVPDGAMDARTVLTLTYDGRSNIQGDLQGIDQFFSIARAPSYSGTITPLLPLQLILGHTDFRGMISNTAYLYQLNDGEWVSNGITITERGTDYLIAQVADFGVYGLLGQTRRRFLPIILRNF